MKKSLVLIAFAVFALVGAEVFARFQVGLGDPPLTVRDPDIEYLFKPSRCYRRFGNDVCYNRWSMRSPEADRFPILVLGDSVVNGGSLTDDSRLGTAILARHLGVAVGNVSAGSWGPPNLLEYTERFGWFGAQSVIVVASSHDLDDIPTFSATLGIDFPEEPPVAALWEAARRYLPRYLPSSGGGPGAAASAAGGERRAVPALRSLLQSASQNASRVILAYHPTRTELQTHDRTVVQEYEGLAGAPGHPAAGPVPTLHCRRLP